MRAFKKNTPCRSREYLWGHYNFFIFIFTFIFNFMRSSNFLLPLINYCSFCATPVNQINFTEFQKKCFKNYYLTNRLFDYDKQEKIQNLAFLKFSVEIPHPELHEHLK